MSWREKNSLTEIVSHNLVQRKYMPSVLHVLSHCILSKNRCQVVTEPEEKPQGPAVGPGPFQLYLTNSFILGVLCLSDLAEGSQDSPMKQLRNTSKNLPPSVMRVVQGRPSKKAERETLIMEFETIFEG